MRPILLVDDDMLQRQALAEELEQELGIGCVTQIGTESQFRDMLASMVADDVPEIVVLDMMLRWTDPSPDMRPPPPDVLAAGYYRAGLRCAELVLRHPLAKDTAVVLHSVLEREAIAEGEELPKSVFYVRKGASPIGLSELCRSILHARGTWRPRPIGTTPLKVRVCLRAHIQADDPANALQPTEFCTDCGTRILEACPQCSSPFQARAGRAGDLLNEQFCGWCGAPHLWASRDTQRLHLENLLQFQDLDEDEQFQLIAEIAVLTTSSDVSDERKIEAAEALKRVAPRAWDLGRPILQSVLTEVVKRRVGLTT